MGKPTTFSDGSECTLRHAPRKKKGTGEKLPVPMTPASAPTHWTNPQMGQPPKPPPEDLVPDFNKWHKAKKIKQSPRKARPGVTPGLPAHSAAPQTPGLPPMKPIVGSHGDVTPFIGAVTGDLLAGEQTPVMTPGITPGMTPGSTGKVGEMTPALPRGSGVGQLHGAQTPVLAAANGTPGLPPEGAPTPRVGANVTNAAH